MSSTPHPQYGQVTPDDGRRISDELWARVAPLIPAPPPSSHPRRGHRPRRPNRQVLDAVLFVMRTPGGQWAHPARAGLGSQTTVYDRFREWSASRLFEALRSLADPELDALAGDDWRTPPRRNRRHSE